LKSTNPKVIFDCGRLFIVFDILSESGSILTTYDIPLETMKTEEKAVNWLEHLKEKVWFSPGVEEAFKTLIEKVSEWKIES